MDMTANTSFNYSQAKACAGGAKTRRLILRQLYYVSDT